MLESIVGLVVGNKNPLGYEVSDLPFFKKNKLNLQVIYRGTVCKFVGYIRGEDGNLGLWNLQNLHAVSYLRRKKSIISYLYSIVSGIEPRHPRPHPTAFPALPDNFLGSATRTHWCSNQPSLMQSLSGY